MLRLLCLLAALVAVAVPRVASAQVDDAALELTANLVIAWRIENRCPGLQFVGGRSVEQFMPYALGVLQAEGADMVAVDRYQRTGDADVTWARMTQIMARRGVNIEDTPRLCHFGRGVAGRNDTIGRWLVPR